VFDAWWSGKLDIPLLAQAVDSASGHDAARAMWRILQIAAGLQRAAHIPAFEPGRILSCRADDNVDGPAMLRGWPYPARKGRATIHLY